LILLKTTIFLKNTVVAFNIKLLHFFAGFRFFKKKLFQTMKIHAQDIYKASFTELSKFL